ncbi:MAG: hypothetical protein UX04_C0002G0273 [Microgenomates group bacterium GW2011_GWF2_45_18]|nr:MAG: hypothetical protein UW18_C0003G0289 [Microgenomates group bacterium GW2011_GWF1_44_10]KKU02130.1 MAG: hypothetical protein UX04_C0002G0273 [Microgenomates group bacterium GW2011_GWF2_45_18]
MKETTVTRAETASNSAQPSTTTEATSSQSTEYILYFILGTVEILLSFRLILKLMGASLSSSFVRFIYGLSGIFTLPFDGIFRKGFSQGIETTSVLEPATIVAMLVYAVLAWGIVALVRVLSGEKQESA